MGATAECVIGCEVLVVAAAAEEEEEEDKLPVRMDAKAGEEVEAVKGADGCMHSAPNASVRREEGTVRCTSAVNCSNALCG